MATFCPYPDGPPRVIDIYAMGRRPAEIHSALLGLAAEVCGHIYIDRRDHQAALDSMAAAESTGWKFIYSRAYQPTESDFTADIAGGVQGMRIARCPDLHFTDLDASVLDALAAMDGAVVTEPGGQLLAVGAILRHPPSAMTSAEGVTEGARTTAAMAASQFGPVLKVSEDGIITFFDRERVWDI